MLGVHCFLKAPKPCRLSSVDPRRMNPASCTEASVHGTVKATALLQTIQHFGSWKTELRHLVLKEKYRIDASCLNSLVIFWNQCTYQKSFQPPIIGALFGSFIVSKTNGKGHFKFWCDTCSWTICKTHWKFQRFTFNPEVSWASNWLGADRPAITSFW